MMRYFTLLILVLWATATTTLAQQSLQGKVVDKNSGESLPGAYIFIKNLENNTLSSTYSDDEGNFTIKKPQINQFILEISFIGYQTLQKRIDYNGSNSLGTFSIEEDTKQLDEVEVQGNVYTGEVKGDTVSFNASAYKTRTQASAGTLIRKMPGVTMQGGTITVQGETVGRVLVDGEPFFGDDPAMAMQNIPVEIIDKIEFLDQKSDQARLTGFDDGETIKTINIITKEDKRGGKFGKIFGGYGTDDNYLLGGNINLFDGPQRLTILGLSNNINQQNFSADDLSGAFGGGNRGRGRGRRGNDLMVRERPGITSTNSFGVNFTDKFDDGKAEFTGSYFFNDSKNTLNRTSSRNYILSNDSLQLYNESQINQNHDQSHRLDMRLEYEFNDQHALIWRPEIGYNMGDAQRFLFGQNLYDSNTPISETRNTTTSQEESLGLESDLTYRFKFNKPGRTISTSIETEYDQDKNESDLLSASQNYQTENLDSLIQKSISKSNSLQYEIDIEYTEPIGKKSQIRLEYELNNDLGDNLQEVSQREMESTLFELDSTLTNEFENGYKRHEIGLGYRYGGEKLRIYSSLDYEISLLDSDRLFPGFENTKRTFKNFVPRIFMNYEPNESTSIRFGYRTDTDAPAVRQLQDVIDNSNPLQISMGNPDLEQEYGHRFFTRIRKINPETSKSFFMWFSGGIRNNFFGNSTFIAEKDTLIQNEVLLRQGGQLSMPVNLSNAWNANTSISFGFPLSFIQSNLNLTTRLNYSKQPGKINGQDNTNQNYGMSQGIGISSNVGEHLDFNISTDGNYNIIRSSLQENLDNDYYYQSTRLDLFWNFIGGFFLSTDINNQFYQGLGDEYDQSIWLMNADFGYQFPPKEKLELKLTIFDLLNQNTSISRNVTDVYIENERTEVLRQFFMLTLTYNLRDFASGARTQAKPQRR
ncbi:TonB-dependent receptor [Echinicola jeungdonensis]|uniref:TonB-dependent receptor domain-containing protein n=1 Tax=Echinicola jeungdonensis TaxID=709343 RepID=A0ABV5J334_9BACT|nr:TonB-dependent receptor [Echinicola jeungdonensis]MDN3670579.1 TonB-dependent receptor [Echinicola jeungdonensis]